MEPGNEPAIDTAPSHYMEARALEIALQKATDAAQRAVIEGLMQRRDALMARREAYGAHAVAMRHARGEVYSSARVAAINAMGPSLATLERDVRGLYLQQPDAAHVLMAHARTHYAGAMMSSRLLLAAHPANVVVAAREMQQHEEDFAAAWLAAVANPGFTAELRRLQRQALHQLRTSARPMYFVTHPWGIHFADVDAVALGKAWNKLDDLAVALGVAPLSEFIALPDEDASSGATRARMLPSVDALAARLQEPGGKFPSKRAVAGALAKVRAALERLPDEGRACFDIDL